MKLSSVHFDDLVPVVGTDQRELAFHASEGWDIERIAPLTYRIRGVERRDGKVTPLDFTAEGFAASWAEMPAPVVVAELEPAPVAAPRRRRA